MAGVNWDFHQAVVPQFCCCCCFVSYLKPFKRSCIQTMCLAIFVLRHDPRGNGCDLPVGWSPPTICETLSQSVWSCWASLCVVRVVFWKGTCIYIYTHVRQSSVLQIVEVKLLVCLSVCCSRCRVWRQSYHGPQRNNLQLEESHQQHQRCVRIQTSAGIVSTLSDMIRAWRVFLARSVFKTTT